METRDFSPREAGPALRTDTQNAPPREAGPARRTETRKAPPQEAQPALHTETRNTPPREAGPPLPRNAPPREAGLPPPPTRTPRARGGLSGRGSEDQSEPRGHPLSIFPTNLGFTGQSPVKRPPGCAHSSLPRASPSSELPLSQASVPQSPRSLPRTQSTEKPEPPSLMLRAMIPVTTKMNSSHFHPGTTRRVQIDLRTCAPRSRA